VLTECTLYESKYDDSAAAGYTTTKVLDEDGNEIKKGFIAPYKGCSDQHTYIEFLE
jgi:hypothetical protein